MREDKLCPSSLSKSSFARSNSSVGTQKGFFRPWCTTIWSLQSSSETTCLGPIAGRQRADGRLVISNKTYSASNKCDGNRCGPLLLPSHLSIGYPIYIRISAWSGYSNIYRILDYRRRVGDVMLLEQRWLSGSTSCSFLKHEIHISVWHHNFTSLLR